MQPFDTVSSFWHVNITDFFSLFIQQIFVLMLFFDGSHQIRDAKLWVNINYNAKHFGGVKPVVRSIKFTAARYIQINKILKVT